MNVDAKTVDAHRNVVDSVISVEILIFQVIIVLSKTTRYPTPKLP